MRSMAVSCMGVGGSAARGSWEPTVICMEAGSHLYGRLAVGCMEAPWGQVEGSSHLHEGRSDLCGREGCLTFPWLGDSR